MADQIKATPRNSVLGLFSDIVNLPLQYMSAPERTQQSQGAAQFLYGTGIPQTLERMSYGDSLFSGAGGLGGTTRMRPETADALMNVAPLAPVVGRVLPKIVRATEGMPVGMSIKEVGKSAITREGNPIQGAVVLVGDKIFMGRTHGDALNRAVYEGVVRKEGGKYIYPKGAEVNSDLFMTKDGQIIDRLQASKMFDIGASETAIEQGLMQNNPPRSMTVDSYIEQATALKKQREQSPAPQQAALDLAQQRAALPVEQGGLGLPPNNTAEMRAQAMGFDINTTRFHGSDQDIYAFDPAKFGKNDQGWYGRGVTTDTDPEIASAYANYNESPSGQVVYPLVSRGKYMQWPEGQQPFSTARDAIQGTKDIQNLGYQGTQVTNDRDLYGSMPQFGTEQVTFDPANIRSRFAAFDPFRKDVATATAMGVALPDLLAQPVNQVQPTYETTPMYTDPFGNTIGSSIR